MAKLVFGMNMSLDGYVDHDRFAPEPALFAYFIERTRNSVGSIHGRGLYEVMRYWDGDAWVHDGQVEGNLRAFAQAWRAMPHLTTHAPRRPPEYPRRRQREAGS